MKFLKSITVITLLLICSASWAQQFVPIIGYRTGPLGSLGSKAFPAMIDYINIVNQNGGINGVKLIVEECETEYNVGRAVECYERYKFKHTGATTFDPINTGAALALMDRLPTDKIPMLTVGIGRPETVNGAVYPWVFPITSTYYDQAEAMIAYLGEKSGGISKLRGKKIAYLHIDAPVGREPMPLFEAAAAKYGFEFIKLPVALPGIEQGAQWTQIRNINPDFIILWAAGAVTSNALQNSKRYAYPAENILGMWWSGSEDEVASMGSDIKGYTAMTYTPPGNYPVIDEIKTRLYAQNLGSMPDSSKVGQINYLRGLTVGVIITEAIRTAQTRFGKGKVMTPEQVRWGLENLNITPARQRELGIFGMFPPIKTSCEDHSGSGAMKVIRWDGAKWQALSKDWIMGKTPLTDKLVKENSEKYAREKGITIACYKQ